MKTQLIGSNYFNLLVGTLLLFLAACTPQPASSGATPNTPPISATLPSTLQVATKSSPTTAATATPVPTPTPTPTPTPEPGMVTGSVCYPGSQNPPMILYLQETTTGDQVELDIPQNQSHYTLKAPPGEYYAYALTVGTEMAGSYSQAVPCGLSAACVDHRLLPFKVQSGQTTEKIDLCDWYNPPGIIPASSAAPKTVTVTTLQKINVFGGPGLDYPLVGPAPSRATAQALGRNEDSSWLQIEYPPAEGSAWIYTPLVQIAGRPETLPIVRSASSSIQATRPKLEPSKDQFAPAAWGASFNEGVVHFKGSISDEAGNPVNGFSILADNGTWSVLSHPTGASHWYPDLSDGEWDIIITNATDAVGWWTLTVVTYDCPNFEGGFNAQCKQFTRLSENQLVKIVYPDETVINADWVCYRDCDQGLYVKAYRP